MLYKVFNETTDSILDLKNKLKKSKPIQKPENP
jgi:hypothetical protein